MNDALSGGFADPVLQSQAMFRAILDVLARPGTVIPLKQDVIAPPPLTPASGAVLCALADEATPVYVDCAAGERDPVSAWIGFHTGARLVREPGEASFAVIARPATMPPLPAFRQGTDDYPDRSATIVLHLDSFAGGRRLALRGPGIDGAGELSPAPLPDRLLAELGDNRNRFPLGVDLILATPDAIAGLPRTTMITDEGGA